MYLKTDIFTLYITLLKIYDLLISSQHQYPSPLLNMILPSFSTLHYYAWETSSALSILFYFLSPLFYYVSIIHFKCSLQMSRVAKCPCLVHALALPFPLCLVSFRIGKLQLVVRSRVEPGARHQLGVFMGQAAQLTCRGF